MGTGSGSHALEVANLNTQALHYTQALHPVPGNITTSGAALHRTRQHSIQPLQHQGESMHKRYGAWSHACYPGNSQPVTAFVGSGPALDVITC